MTLPRQLPKWSEFSPNKGFVRDLLRIFGTDFTLPDASSIQLILEPTVHHDEDHIGRNTEEVWFDAYVPNSPDHLGSLAQETTIMANGVTSYFVNNFRSLKNGWLVVALAQRDA